MRNIFKRLGLRASLTQGSVINHCRANDYPAIDAFGMVITPRCDLDHDIKVSSIHYLPIIPLKQWQKYYLNNLLKKRIASNNKDKLNTAIVKAGGMPGFMQTEVASELTVKDILLKGLDEKSAKYKDVVALIRDYFQISDATIAQDKYKSVRDHILKDLFRQNLHSFYLMESWSKNNDDDYFVILLREIHEIMRDVASLYQTGFFYDMLSDKQQKLHAAAFPDNFDKQQDFKIVAELNSPFIEHVLQSYSYNFTRIGVEDMDETSWNNYLQS